LDAGPFDYVFVDPPFGANIPYSEANFIGEAWLGKFSDPTEEVSVSPYRNRTHADYSGMLTDALIALRDRLKPDGQMTVMFHSTESESWAALLAAVGSAGLAVESTMTLDKVQSSFKQVRSTIAVEGDVLLQLRPLRGRLRRPAGIESSASPREWLESRGIDGASEKLTVKAKRQLYSLYVAACATAGVIAPAGASEFHGTLEDVVSVGTRTGQMPLGELT
jgi:hypothetical protein